MSRILNCRPRDITLVTSASGLSLALRTTAVSRLLTAGRATNPVPLLVSDSLQPDDVYLLHTGLVVPSQIDVTARALYANWAAFGLAVERVDWVPLRAPGLFELLLSATVLVPMVLGPLGGSPLVSINFTEPPDIADAAMADWLAAPGIQYAIERKGVHRHLVERPTNNAPGPVKAEPSVAEQTKLVNDWLDSGPSGVEAKTGL